MHHGKALRLLLRYRGSFAWAACSLLHSRHLSQSRKSAFAICFQWKETAFGAKAGVPEFAICFHRDGAVQFGPEFPEIMPSLFPGSATSPGSATTVQQLRFSNCGSATVVQQLQFNNDASANGQRESSEFPYWDSRVNQRNT